MNDGHLTIDNNHAERAIKPFVIDRKNYTANGANASGMLYSIIETAKANGLTPFNYVTHYLEQLSDQNAIIETLLPWNVKLS